MGRFIIEGREERGRQNEGQKENEREKGGVQYLCLEEKKEGRGFSFLITGL